MSQPGIPLAPSTGPHEVLKKFWGYSAFRPLQEDIINSILQGKDTLALMPTGGGKSLCYQVPAMVMEGTCLVISPLIALMKDQVEGLRRKNITAFAIYSGMSRKEVINTLKTVTESNCKFLYVSPERLETYLFKEYLPGMHINLVAVDEAHCISQWGYDFRPSYLRIATLRKELPAIPVLALTASATPDVQADIRSRLDAGTPGKWAIFRQSFERPNLSYSVFTADSRINKIIDILKKVPGTGIVYCKSRRRTKEISELLQLQQIPADYYHAGLSQEERNRKQEDWINNKIRVIVCTNAFGMGIDKPDVRIVVHADTPDCLENYYQEAGRAGRDGKTSYAALLYDDAELEELKSLVDQRFPSQDEVRNVYQSVANYLQLPAGAGAGEYYDFEIADFARKFKLSAFASLHALKALESEGWLSFNEQVFLPSSIRFTMVKDRLYAFEKDYPSLEPLIKTILRTYEGIFDNNVFVSELLLAQLQRKDLAVITSQLMELDRAGVIEYNPRKDNPQLYFLRNRVKVEELVIDTEAYRQRKENFRQRIHKMIAYVKEKLECRSRITASYFGDTTTRACGICDNCLRQKALPLNQEELEKIRFRILDLVNQGPMRINELLLELKSIHKEKIWKVLELMQSENQLNIQGGDLIRPAKKNSTAN